MVFVEWAQKESEGPEVRVLSFQTETPWLLGNEKKSPAFLLFSHMLICFKESKLIVRSQI